MSHLAAWKVTGPVRRLRTEFAEWDLTGEEWKPPRGFTLVHFRPDGKIDEMEAHNPDGSISRSRNEYDDVGKLVEARFRMNEGPETRTLYTYDDHGRAVRVVHVETGSDARDVEIDSYDEDGIRTKIQFLEPQKPNTGYMFGIEGSEQAYGATGATTITTRFDRGGKAIEALFHDKDQQLLRRITLIWDNAGRLVQEELHWERPLFEHPASGENPGSESPESFQALFAKVFGAQNAFAVTTHVYDQQGRRVERITRYGQIGEERTTFCYDAHGNPVEESRHDFSRELDLDDQGNLQTSKENSHVQHSRFEYAYDTRGNWTERVVWGRLEPNPNFERSNVERREIDYWADG
jgi:YD repeat-containing protein